MNMSHPLQKNMIFPQPLLGLAREELNGRLPLQALPHDMDLRNILSGY